MNDTYVRATVSLFAWGDALGIIRIVYTDSQSNCFSSKNKKSSRIECLFLEQEGKGQRIRGKVIAKEKGRWSR